MGKDINLDGGEISVIKALGFGGGDVSGKVLMDRVGMEARELLETIEGLMSVGFVNCDKTVIRNGDELKAANFQVNSGYVRDLKNCIEPEEREVKSKRVRRE